MEEKEPDKYRSIRWLWGHEKYKFGLENSCTDQRTLNRVMADETNPGIVATHSILNKFISFNQRYQETVICENEEWKQSTLRLNLSDNGHFLKDIVLKCSLTFENPVTLYEWPGERIFSKFALVLGGRRVAEHSNNVLKLVRVMNLNREATESYARMCGHRRSVEVNLDSTQHLKMVQRAHSTDFDLWIPLQFWFCEYGQNALPCRSLENSYIELSTGSGFAPTSPKTFSVRAFSNYLTIPKDVLSGFKKNIRYQKIHRYKEFFLDCSTGEATIPRISEAVEWAACAIIPDQDESFQLDPKTGNRFLKVDEDKMFVSRSSDFQFTCDPLTEAIPDKTKMLLVSADGTELICLQEHAIGATTLNVYAKIQYSSGFLLSNSIEQEIVYSVPTGPPLKNVSVSLNGRKMFGQAGSDELSLNFNKKKHFSNLGCNIAHWPNLHFWSWSESYSSEFQPSGFRQIGQKDELKFNFDPVDGGKLYVVLKVLDFCVLLDHKIQI